MVPREFAHHLKSGYEQDENCHESTSSEPPDRSTTGMDLRTNSSQESLWQNVIERGVVQNEQAERNRKRIEERIGTEDVRIVNQNLAANSERFIMGASRVQLENIVLRSGCTGMETIPRVTLETTQSDENGSIQMLSTQPRRYFYSKNGARRAP